MPNSVLCTKCENWFCGKCANIKRVTARLAMLFVCSKCIGIMEGTVDSIETLCDELETVNGFCYLGDRLIAIGQGSPTGGPPRCLVRPARGIIIQTKPKILFLYFFG